MSTWEISGLSLQFDASDADSTERYEQAFDLLETEIAELPETGRASERIRAYCAVFRRLYDRIFGEGTAEEIFRDIPANTNAYDEVYVSFLTFIGVQAEEIAKQKAVRAEQLRKFVPNRAQRRAKNK